MKITRDNYEAYFLDYLEGNLDENLIDGFIDFLRQNPELKEELEMAGSVKVELESIFFGGKEKLYKEKYDLENGFNHAAVALVEGDLSESEKAAFQNYLSKHPEKQKEAAFFEKTKLKADKSIIFRKKTKLYQYSTGRTILIWSTRIAAILVLAFMIYQFPGIFDSNNITPDNQIVLSEKKPNKEPAESTILPETRQKKEDPAPVDKKVTEPVIKTGPKAEPAKSLHENTKSRADHEKIAEARIPVEVPAKLSGQNASLSIQQPKPVLAYIEITFPENLAEKSDERLLADIVKEKTRIGNLTLNKVAKAGLSLVSNISKEKFNYETNSDGKIIELNYDSRLLAFSIPTSNNEE